MQKELTYEDIQIGDTAVFFLKPFLNMIFINLQVLQVISTLYT